MSCRSSHWGPLVLCRRLFRRLDDRLASRSASPGVTRRHRRARVCALERRQLACLFAIASPPFEFESKSRHESARSGRIAHLSFLFISRERVSQRASSSSVSPRQAPVRIQPLDRARRRRAVAKQKRKEERRISTLKLTRKPNQVKQQPTRTRPREERLSRQDGPRHSLASFSRKLSLTHKLKLEESHHSSEVPRLEQLQLSGKVSAREFSCCDLTRGINFFVWNFGSMEMHPFESCSEC